MKIKISQTVDIRRLPMELRTRLDGTLQTLARTTSRLVGVEDAALLLLDSTVGESTLVSIREQIDLARQELYLVEVALEDWDNILKDFSSILDKQKKETQ